MATVTKHREGPLPPVSDWCRSWQTGAVTETPDGPAWLTVPDLSARWDIAPSRVRRLIEDGHLIASRREGPLAVPALFLDEEGPLVNLRGTVFLLRDAGFTDDEAIDWLLTEGEQMDVAPIEALRAGRKAEVRRVAQALL